MLLEAHHAAARKIVLAVHRDLEQLETGRNVSLDLQLQISQNLNALARELHVTQARLCGRAYFAMTLLVLHTRDTLVEHPLLAGEQPAIEELVERVLVRAGLPDGELVHGARHHLPRAQFTQPLLDQRRLVRILAPLVVEQLLP